MATTTQLVELIADDTGLDQSFTDAGAAGGVPSYERALILRRLNDEYRKLVGDLELRTLRGTLTTTAGQDTYNVGPGLDIDLPNLIGFKKLVAIGSGNNTTGRVMVNVQDGVIEEALTPTSNANSFSYMYSYQQPELRISPRPRGGLTINFSYYALPNELIESPPPAGAGALPAPATGETTPLSINPMFHEDVLALGARIRVLKGYEGRVEEGMALEQMYQENLRLLRSHVIRQQGTDGPRDHWWRNGVRGNDIA